MKLWFGLECTGVRNQSGPRLQAKQNGKSKALLITLIDVIGDAAKAASAHGFLYDRDRV